MKIVMVCEFYNEGLEYQENLLTKYYTKNGHQVTVLTSTFESVFDYYGDRHDASVPSRTFFDGKAKIMKLRYRYNILNRIRPLAPFLPTLEAEKPDLIYFHDINPNLTEAVRYLKKHPRCRMILDYHADYSNSGKNWISLKILHGLMRKYFLDRARPFISRIFPIVPASMQFLNEIYNVPLSDMEILPLGADLDAIREIQGNSTNAQLRERYGIADGDQVIVTGGKLAPSKRTEVLIRAFKMLAKDRRLHLIVIGEAAEADRTYKQSLLDEAGDDKRIHFAGWLGPRDIYRHYDLADIAVFPASQSVMWQQAIASGLPLVAGNTGHQSIAYLNLEDNIVIVPKDEIRPESFARIVGSILDDPARVRRMSEGARKVADEHLNWDRLIERTLRYNSQASD